MIGKAKSISHGYADLAYITGESANKKHPEKIFRLHDNLMPSHLDAAGIWDHFQIELGAKAGKFKNEIVRIEISPALENTKDFTLDDWRELLFEVLREADNIELRDRNGKLFSERTNFSNSLYTAWLHFDSDSGVPHIHVGALRVDKYGMTNNDHSIHKRFQLATQKVALRRGWTTPKEIRMASIAKLELQCETILKDMQKFSFDDYFKAIEDLPDGYIVVPKHDKQGTLVNYAVYKDPDAKRQQPADIKKLKKNKYKASDIGKGRHYMVSTLQQTWEKLHADLQQDGKQLADKVSITRQQAASNVSASVQTPCTASAEPLHSECRGLAPVVQSTRTGVNKHDYTTYKRGTIPYDYIGEEGKTCLYIPEEVMDFFNDEYDYRFIANCDELIQTAIGVFVGIIVGPTEQVQVGSGGTTSDLPWRDKDDDDLRWAHKCAQYATAIHSKKPRVHRTR